MRMHRRVCFCASLCVPLNVEPYSLLYSLVSLEISVIFVDRVTIYYHMPVCCFCFFVDDVIKHGFLWTLTRHSRR